MSILTVSTPTEMEGFIMDAAAMQRLLENADFQMWQKAQADARERLVEEFEKAPAERLQYFQGRIAESRFILSLPKKIVAEGERLVELRRQDQEGSAV